MALLTYPSSPKPSYAYEGSSDFNTLINQYSSGLESRFRLMRFPKRNFNLIYNNLLLADRDILHDFYRQVYGMSDSFWFVDFASKKWYDEYVGRGVLFAVSSAKLFDSPSYVTYTTEANNSTVNDVMLTPASPTSSDDFMIGWTTKCPDVIRFNIGTVGATYTINWQYHRSAGWNNCSNVTDGTNHFRNSGLNDVKFDKPTDADLFEVDGVTAYWVRGEISGAGTQALANQIWVGSRYYDIHGVTTSGLAVYVDGVLKTGGGTDYTFYSGGGDAGADRIRFVSMPTIGSLITSNFSGYLRMKGRMGNDSFKEVTPTFIPSGVPVYNCGVAIREVQW